MASSSSATLNQENNSTKDLPDDVLQHIFSYLDMKDVVQTSMLAKRWRYFWRSHPFLNLDEKVFISYPNYGLCDFAGFVTRVLLLRDRSIIHAFRLRISSFSMSEDIDAWMQSILQCNVQQLSIEYYSPHHREYFDMPFVFKSKFLTKIHLGGVAEDEYSYGTYSLEVRLPNLIDLPVLTKLRLEAIRDLSTEDLDKLFTGCPVLETLEIINCEFDFSRSLTISALQLKHLVIQFGQVTYPYNERIPNPKSITLSCPNLILFRCRDYLTCIYHLESLRKLEIADMNMEGPVPDSCRYDLAFLFDEPSEIEVVRDIQPMINSLECLYNVKSLTLCPALLQVLSEYLRELKQPNIQFGNLRYLNISTPMAKPFMPAIKYLLNSSPKIESFVIQILSMDFQVVFQREVYIANNFENWGEKLSLKHHLKSIEVRGVEGSVDEIEFLKAMLEKAVILEKMTVYTSKKISAKNQERHKVLSNELLACPRASLNAQIIFCKF